MMAVIVKAYESILKSGNFHRDIKPENILFRRQGNGMIFKFADFGLATTISRDNHTSVTGTEQYAAP